MKRAIAISLTILFILAMSFLVLNVYGITIEQGNKDLVLYCHNATNGKLLGTTATINATNSASSVTLATQTMTNQNTGKFNITVNLAPDTYTLQIDCGHADNLDYTRILYVDNRRQGLIANAVNTSTASSATIVTAGTVSDKMGYGLTGNAVNSSTLSATGTTIATVTSVTNGVTVTTNNDKTGYTVSTNQDKNGYSLAPNSVNSTTLAASAVGAINGSIGQVTGAVNSVTSGVTVTTNNDKTGYSLTTADWTTDSDLTPITTALSGNASNWFTSTYQTRLDAAISSRSSHSAADVWTSATRTLTAFAFNVGLLSNAVNDTTVANTARVGLIGTAVNTSTAVNLDAAISTRSSHSAADVDNLIADEVIQGAIDGNATGWAATTSTVGLATSSELATTSTVVNRTEVGLRQNGTLISRTVGGIDANATNWFTGTYQTRLDAAISSRASATNLESNTSTILANFVTVTNNQDTINLNVKEVNTTTRAIKGATDGNASNWFVGTYQTRLDAAISSRSSHSAADVWASATRTLTNFMSVALNSTGIQSLTQNISVNLTTDHGVGEWNNTATTISLSNIDQIIRGTWQNISVNLTTDHSAGNWSDKNTAATSTLTAIQVLNASATCTGYNTASLGCIVESIEKYAR